MWRRIVNWFRARRLDNQRLLYEIWDGRTIRRIDPWLAYRRLLGAPDFGLHDHLPGAIAGEEPELTKACDAICQAFGVERYDADTGRGLTDEELLKTLSDFLDYCELLQKKTLGWPILSRPSEPRASVGQDFLAQITN